MSYLQQIKSPANRRVIEKIRQFANDAAWYQKQARKGASGYSEGKRDAFIVAAKQLFLLVKYQY